MISADQVNIQVIPKSKGNVNFNFNYQNKDNEKMIYELGWTIV